MHTVDSRDANQSCIPNQSAAASCWQYCYKYTMQSLNSVTQNIQAMLIQKVYLDYTHCEAHTVHWQCSYQLNNNYQWKQLI